MSGHKFNTEFAPGWYRCRCGDTVHSTDLNARKDEVCAAAAVEAVRSQLPDMQGALRRLAVEIMVLEPKNLTVSADGMTVTTVISGETAVEPLHEFLSDLAAMAKATAE